MWEEKLEQPSNTELRCNKYLIATFYQTHHLETSLFKEHGDAKLRKVSKFFSPQSSPGEGELDLLEVEVCAADLLEVEVCAACLFW